MNVNVNVNARRRRLVEAVALAVALAASCQTNPCKEGTWLLTVVVDGPAAAADELRVEVTTQGQTTRAKTFAHEPGTGGGTIQIDYPAGYTTGTTSTAIVRAFNTGSATPIAVGTATVSLADRCSTATVRLEYPGDGGTPVCGAGATCTPASGAQPCDEYRIDCSTGAPVCQRAGSKPPGMTCPTGVCSQGGTCVACQNGGDCMPTAAAAACKVGALACASGAPTCNATTTNRPDGFACGFNKVCRGGACTDCVANQACTPPAGVCVNGATSCTSGTSVCQPTTPMRAGQSCGTNMVCNGGSACVACQQGSSCTPNLNTCRAGTLDCTTGAPVCMETSQALADGLMCATDKLCAAGTCASAGNWITRGEDSRTSPGGYVYSYAFGGATVVPPSGPSDPAFPPSAGGVTGKALAISGMVPPEDPTMNLFTGAGVAFTFTSTGASLNVAARGSGIQFQAKSAQPIVVIVHAVDIWTSDRFSNCSTSTAPTIVHRCFQYPENTCTIPGGNVWTQCRFNWSDFKRPVWGSMGDGLPLDSSAMTDVQLQTPLVPMGTTALTYSFAIDDVAFVP